METHGESEAVHLSEADRARMSKLYEEVTERLNEMGIIVARALDYDPGAPLESVRVRSQHSPDFHVAAVAYHFMPCNFGCYDWGKGICRPCGAGD